MSAPSHAETATSAGSIGAALQATEAASRVRPLAASDLDFVRELFHDDRAVAFQPLGLPPSQLKLLLDQQFEAQRASYANRYPQAEHLLVLQHDRPAGRLIVTLRATSDDQRPALLVVDILIDRSQRGRGIGTTLLTSLAQAARGLGASRLELSVLDTNVGAQRLYQRLGYTADAPSPRNSSHIALVKQLS